MPSRFRQVNEVCLRRRKSRYTPGAKTAGPSPEKGDTGGAWILSAPNEENARRAECPPPCNSPASRPGASAPRLHPTFSGGFSQWRTFVPAALAASVHPCAHSTGRAGFGYPFPSMPTPGPWWAVRSPATLDQQTVYLLVSDIILQELAVVNPPPYPNATSRIIITVKPAAKASAPGPESPRVGSSSAATT